MERGKVVVIGDDGVGKTCGLISYTCQTFPGEYTPMKIDDYTANVMIDGKPWALSLFDSNGAHEKKQDRFETYSKGTEVGVFLIYFDVMNRESFNNVETFWIKEIEEYNMEKQLNIPYLLIACKTDLRDSFYKDIKKDIHLSLDDQQCVKLVNGYCHNYKKMMSKDVINVCFKYYFMDKPITREQIKAMNQRIKASQFLEHSALTQEGLKQVFDEAIRTIRQSRTPNSKKRSKSCVIL